MKQNETFLNQALQLCGIGHGSKHIVLNFDPIPCWDKDEKPHLHYHINAASWEEYSADGLRLRWGFITHKFRVTECSGKWPSIQQKVLEFGRWALPDPSKPEPHQLETDYTRNRFSFLDGRG